MSCCSSFFRTLRSRNLRNSISNSVVKNVSLDKDALRIDRQCHIYSSYGNRAATTNGLQSLGRMHMSGYHPSQASGSRAMHWITFPNYQRMGYYRDSMRKIKSPYSKAVLELGRVRPRFYSGGPDSVLWTLIGANVVVFAMWHKVNYRFMDKHFMVSIDSVLSGRLHTILTSAFSQRDMVHLISNLIGLYFFGSEIASIFGGKYLLTLYLAGAIGGSVGHLFYFAYVYPWLKDIPLRFYNTRHTPGALGASGAVTTVMLLHIFLYPKHTILLYMLIPMPAALMGAIIIGRDLWLAKQGDTDVSVGGHIGGAVVAFLAFLAKRAYWF